MSGPHHTMDAFVAAWGEPFVSDLDRFLFPSLLAPGNAGALAASGGCLRLFVQAQDRRRVAKMASFRRLERVLTIEFEPLAQKPASSSGADKYSLWRELVTAEVSRARESDHALMFLSPETVASRDFITTVMKRFDEGAAAVMMFATTLAGDAALDTRLEAWKTRSGALDIPPQDLAELAASFPDPALVDGWGGPDRALRELGWHHPMATDKHARGLFWKLGPRRFLCRPVFLTPVAVMPSRHPFVIHEAIDSCASSNAALLRRTAILTDFTEGFAGAYETRSDTMVCRDYPSLVFLVGNGHRVGDAQASLMDLSLEIGHTEVFANADEIRRESDVVVAHVRAQLGRFAAVAWGNRRLLCNDEFLRHHLFRHRRLWRRRRRERGDYPVVARLLDRFIIPWRGNSPAALLQGLREAIAIWRRRNSSRSAQDTHNDI